MHSRPETLGSLVIACLLYLPYLEWPTLAAALAYWIPQAVLVLLETTQNCGRHFHWMRVAYAQQVLTPGARTPQSNEGNVLSIDDLLR